MKKTHTFLSLSSILACSLGIAQATPVVVNVYRGESSSGSVNIYGSNEGVTLPLQDTLGQETSYTLKIVKSTGNFFNQTVTTVTVPEGESATYAYYQNKAAMEEFGAKFGQPDASSLSTFLGPGAGYSTTSLIQLGGLTSGSSMEVYLFVSSLQTAPGGMTVSGGTGTFTYAYTSGNGFSETATFANNQLTLVKWSGEVTGDTLDFSFDGGYKAGASMIAFQLIPEPSTASLGLLGLSLVALRRRRS